MVVYLVYFNADDQREALFEHKLAVVTKIKKNTVIPKHLLTQRKIGMWAK